MDKLWHLARFAIQKTFSSPGATLHKSSRHYRTHVIQPVRLKFTLKHLTRDTLSILRALSARSKKCEVKRSHKPSIMYFSIIDITQTCSYLANNYPGHLYCTRHRDPFYILLWQKSQMPVVLTAGWLYFKALDTSYETAESQARIEEYSLVFGARLCLLRGTCLKRCNMVPAHSLYTLVRDCICNANIE
jgi:hypothetical protein